MSVVILLWIVTFLTIRWLVASKNHSFLYWDSAWYVSIAQSGYRFDGNVMHQQNVAFLPALPLVERLMFALKIPLPLAVDVPCITSAISGILLLYRAIAARFAPLWSATGCALIVASPFSLYFLNGYSESLYLLCFGAFFWALWSRQNPALAALFAGLASAVRPYGLLLTAIWAASLVIEGRREGKTPKEIAGRLLLYGPLCVSGFVVTSLFFYYEFGDLFLYRNIMVAWVVDTLHGSPGDIGDHFIAVGRVLTTIDLAHLLVSTEFARLLFWSTVFVIPLVARRLPLAATLYGSLLVMFIVVNSETGADLGRHLSTNLALPLGLLALIWSPQSVFARSSQWALLVVVWVATMSMQAVFISRYFQAQWVS